MRRVPFGKFVWMSVLLAAATADAAPITCVAEAIDPASYRLSTIGVARLDNFTATDPAEHALRLDPANLLAHGHLARQYLIAGEDASYTDAAWRAVLDNGGAVVWTATLYDVDTKSFFLVAFDRAALRIYRYGELAGPYETRLGMPQVVGEERERFWRALGGCIDPQAVPEAVIPWGQVREIKSGNWVHYFKLTAPVVVTSDRGKRKTLDEIKVNLHGGAGTVDYLVTRDALEPWNPYKASVRGIGMGPLAYQERVRHTLVKFVDPAGRIALPKASKSAGW